jgi:hypothetical protein
VTDDKVPPHTTEIRPRALATPAKVKLEHIQSRRFRRAARAPRQIDAAKSVCLAKTSRPSRSRRVADGRERRSRQLAWHFEANFFDSTSHELGVVSASSKRTSADRRWNAQRR